MFSSLSSTITSTYINLGLLRVIPTASTLPQVGRGGRVVARRTFGRGDRGSKPRVAERRTFRSKGPGFKTTCCRFKTWANLFTPLCSCLSEETLKAVGPFYLVSMPGEVKDPTQGVSISNPPIPGT